MDIDIKLGLAALALLVAVVFGQAVHTVFVELPKQETGFTYED